MRFFFVPSKADSLFGLSACLPLRGMRLACMRCLCLACLLLLGSGFGLLAPSYAFATSDSDEASASASLDAADEEPEGLPNLLDALALSEDGQAADALARQIQRAWNASGSASVDVLMARATLAIRGRNLLLALDLLDTVVVLAPDFAEGWNRRATVHFLRNDYALSIADVEQVLRLEPRHFGALSGLGIMLDELGQDRQAQLFLSEALRVHPHLTKARERLSDIEDRLRGAPI